MSSKKVAFMSFLPLLGKYFRQIIFSVSMILLSNLCLTSCENEVVQTVKEDTEVSGEKLPVVIENAAVPVIINQPVNVLYTEGSSIPTISVTAISPDGGWDIENLP